MSARLPLVLPILACMAGAGCSYSYQPLGNAPGSLTLAAPPGSMQGAVGPAPPSSSGPPVSGPYRGEAVALNDPGGVCGTHLQVTNWIVRGDQVSFGAFDGTIHPDGTLLMQAGPRYVQGRFTGSHFQGRFTQPPPSCAYEIAVDPIG